MTTRDPSNCQSDRRTTPTPRKRSMQGQGGSAAQHGPPLDSANVAAARDGEGGGLVCKAHTEAGHGVIAIDRWQRRGGCVGANVF